MIEIEEFEIDGYIVPKFKLEKGKVARIWVEIMPLPNSKRGDGHKVAKKLGLLFANNNKMEISNTHKFHSVEKIRQNFYSKHFIKPTLKEFLHKKGILPDSKITSTLNSFGIDTNTELKLIVFQKRKLVEILIGFLERDNVIFDYYSLGPPYQEKLTEYVITQVKSGKTAIGFDNLAYISDINHNQSIINLEMKRAMEIKPMASKILW
jgi:hypothetical protein